MGQAKGAYGRNTPKVKLNFDFPGGWDDVVQRKWADANPFEALNREDDSSNFLRKILEDLEGGWIF
jgi:hypothetical protein